MYKRLRHFSPTLCPCASARRGESSSSDLCCRSQLGRFFIHLMQSLGRRSRAINSLSSGSACPWHEPCLGPAAWASPRSLACPCSETSLREQDQYYQPGCFLPVLPKSPSYLFQCLRSLTRKTTPVVRVDLFIQGRCRTQREQKSKGWHWQVISHYS